MEQSMDTFETGFIHVQSFLFFKIPGGILRSKIYNQKHYDLIQ